MVATLIAHKANVHLVDECGQSPLGVAAENNHVEAINALLKAGADITQPLFLAAEKNHVTALSALLEAGADVNQLDQTQRSPLFVAALKNHREVVCTLLDAGADPHLAKSPISHPRVKEEMKKLMREKYTRGKRNN